jgi:hypothetical protein
VLLVVEAIELGLVLGRDVDLGDVDVSGHGVGFSLVVGFLI